VQLPGVDSSWTLIGSGDFTSDRRPDLVWRHGSSKDVHIWRMNGAAYVNSIALDIPAGWWPEAVGDISLSGPPDFMYSRMNNQGMLEYAIQNTSGGGQLRGVYTAFGVNSSIYSRVAAVGRYHSTGGAGDLWFTESMPANTSSSRWLQTLSTARNGYPEYAARTNAENLGSGEHIQGPR
jgi:hypothetical protein